VKTSCRNLTVLALLAMVSGSLDSQGPGPDWPQFRGPNRDGVVASFTEPKAWPDKLTQAWKVSVGEGHASPILIGGRVYVFARQGTNEVMQALDAATGKTLWQTRYTAPVTVNPAAQAHGAGPKATPTFANGRLYTLGMGGIVTAFDAATGKQLWQKPASGPLPLYGTSMSPLVDRGLVVVHVGGHDKGALTAFDANTGEVKWTWTGDGPSYSSPIAADVDGVHQIITLTQDNIVGVSAADGRLLWRRPYKTEYTQNIIDPMLVGNTLLVAGYQNPTMAIRLVRKGDQ
jgi:outer membrane protein assembly factor BamB